MSRTTSKIIGAALIVFTLGGGAALAQGTMAQQDACRPDVFRLCGNYIPDVSQIVACLHGNEAVSNDRSKNQRNARALGKVVPFVAADVFSPIDRAKFIKCPEDFIWKWNDHVLHLFR